MPSILKRINFRLQLSPRPVFITSTFNPTRNGGSVVHFKRATLSCGDKVFDGELYRPERPFASNNISGPFTRSYALFTVEVCASKI